MSRPTEIELIDHFYYLGVPLATNILEARVGLSPLALFALEIHGSKKELKQWLNPSRDRRKFPLVNIPLCKTSKTKQKICHHFL
jgi:hypothetical protein